MNTIKAEKIIQFEEIQEFSPKKDVLSVQTTRVMAAVWHSEQQVTSGAGDCRIYLKIVTGCKLRGEDTRTFLVVVFSQVLFVLAGFWVICSEDRTRRIFQLANLCLLLKT
jgi:hypothetical protein